jgi:hypothetical protein
MNSHHLSRAEQDNYTRSIQRGSRRKHLQLIKYTQDYKRKDGINTESFVLGKLGQDSKEREIFKESRVVRVEKWRVRRWNKKQQQ